MSTSLSMTSVAKGLIGVRMGSGPPILVMPPFNPATEPTRGRKLALRVSWLKPLAEHFTVHYVPRPSGLRPGTTAQQIAEPYAALIRDLGAPVPVLGCSSGGVFGLQLAADHPELVSRLVLVSSAHRMGPVGDTACERFIAHAEGGAHRRAAAAMADGMSASPIIRGALRALTWTAGLGKGYDPGDAVATLRAELDFDGAAVLEQVRCPVLLVVGDRDLYYPPDAVEECRQGLADTQVVHIRGGHAAPVLRGRYAPAVLDFLRA